MNVRALDQTFWARGSEADDLLTVEENVLLLFPALNLDQPIAQHGLDMMEQCL
jgi:hypothetical protein